MLLPEHATALIKLSLKGLGQEPDYDSPDGLGFVLVYESGLTLYLLFRACGDERVVSSCQPPPHRHVRGGRRRPKDHAFCRVNGPPKRASRHAFPPAATVIIGTP